MTLLGYVSLGLLLAVGVWSIMVLAWAADWRIRGLAGLLGLVILANVLPIVSETRSWGLRADGPGDPADLFGGLVAFVAVLLLDRILRRNQLLERRLGGHLEYLEDLFESLDEAMVLMDHEGRILRANRAFHGMFGLRPGQVEGKGPWEVMAPGPLLDAARETTEAVIRGEQVNRTAAGVRSDGTPLDLTLLAGPVKLPEAPVGGFILFRDITLLREVEGTFRHFKTALEQTQVGVTITDLDGKIIYTNPADAEMHGYTPEELVGEDVRILAPRHLANPLSRDEVETMGARSRETVNLRRDGTVFPVQLSSDVVRDADDRAIGIVTTCQDITERKLQEQRLKESEERYALAVRGASDGLWDWNLETDEVFYSSLWKSMLGFDEVEIGNRLDEWLDRVHPDDLQRVEEALDSHRQGTSDRLEVEHRIRDRDDVYRWFLVRGIAERGPDGDPYRIAGALTDITVRKVYESRLEEDALHDTLTGLANRSYFQDVLERSFSQRERKGDSTFAVLFLDLDRFKDVNDTFGHLVGDKLLGVVARRLEDTLRPGDMVARLGGDEFCVHLAEIHGTMDATRIARRIQSSFNRPMQIDGREIEVSVSIGIAVADEGLPDTATLLRNADSAMYRAKSAGKSGVEVFDRTMHEQAMNMLRLETDLSSALHAGQFHLLYQPVVSLDSRGLVGLEALLRWNHPEHGELVPDRFLKIAEQTGQIVPIGLWVVREACRQLGRWRREVDDMDGLSVSVNVSYHQVRQPDFVDQIREILEDEGVHPRDLELEISEKILTLVTERDGSVIDQLLELGVRVQLDDFGTGETSLAFLSELPVHSLKIDQAFIGSRGFPQGREGIVDSMITLARELGVRTIAEGVETGEQADRLLSLGCDSGQGYYFSPPLSPADLIPLLKKERQVQA